MMNKFQKFMNDETGAVTVDWVVLTAAIVGIGVLVIGSVQTATVNLGANINDRIANYED